ncbi:MAG TPA: aldolase/citrate lyase family protein [Opitutaceae bacterium]|nr:aldolase/citrate lyase family protein [Opitutaceae bacterium]
MNGETIRESLHNGKRIYGTHITGLSNAVTTRILSSAPLDFVFFCTEHMPLDRAETSLLSQHFGALGISPIVRISSPDPFLAAMALDAGAEGIVVPYVETVEQVQALVGAVHYRPIKGRKLQDLLSQDEVLTPATQTFLRRFNRHNYLIIGIESVEAYKNLDALIGVEGVDGVFMGPHDLSVSLDVAEEWGNPRLLHLIEDTVRRCRLAGIGVGVHLSPIFSQEQTERFISLGMNWLLDGADVSHVLQGLKQRRQVLCGSSAPVPVRDGAPVSSCLSSASATAP